MRKRQIQKVSGVHSLHRLQSLEKRGGSTWTGIKKHRAGNPDGRRQGSSNPGTRGSNSRAGDTNGRRQTRSSASEIRQQEYTDFDGLRDTLDRLGLSPMLGSTSKGAGWMHHCQCGEHQSGDRNRSAKAWIDSKGRLGLVHTKPAHR